MVGQVLIDGVKTGAGSTDNGGYVYADVYFRALDSDGTPNFLQEMARTYDGSLVEQAGKWKSGDVKILDVTAKSLRLQAVLD